MTTDVVPILRVADAAASARWYRRLGFEQTFEHRFEPHLPAYIGIRREGAQLHLSEHEGDATPERWSSSGSPTSTLSPRSTASRCPWRRGAGRSHCTISTETG